MKPFVLGGNRVEDLAAADGSHRGVAADHEPIIADQGERLLQAHLRRGGLAGHQLLPVQKDQIAHGFAGTGVESHLRAAFDRLFVAGKVVKVQVQHVVGNEGVFPGQDVSPVDGGFFQALEVDGRAHARFSRFLALVVNLDASDLGGGPARIDHDALTDLDSA